MTLTQNRYRISPVVAKRAILLLVLSVVPIPLIHEFGHWSASELQGVPAKIIIDLPAMKTIASSIPANTFLYYFMGGGLACLVASVIAFSFRRHKSILIAMSTVAISQFVTSIVETFLHDFYVDQFWVPVLSYMVFIPLLVKLGKNTYNMEVKSVTIPYPKFLKSVRLMIVSIAIIAILVIDVDTLSTPYFISHYKYGILAEDNLLARMLISSSGFALILGIKTLGVSAMTFVSYTVSKVKRFLPLVNLGLLSITSQL